MGSLRKELRRELEKTVIAARIAGEKGARKAIETLAVQNGKPWPTMAEEQKQLRNRLRAHGKQLGDLRNLRNDEQSIEHLVQECAYEHWHRMLFARFLAECDLLIEPDSGVAISLEECRGLALERGVDWLVQASEFAVKMLSQIFRAGDPILDISLPPETRQELEGLMKSLSREVFVADDSLGWVYQFWQAEKKNEVNASGEKIGADELASVTQLFTEDYMVLFLLHNTIGAWWAGKVLIHQPDLAITAKSEDELRAACAVEDVSWSYLRFVRDDEGRWRPAAGTFEGWPKDAKDLKVLDPCMGSGHFLVFSLTILIALRMTEEKLSRQDAIEAVLRDNLYGLELDNRCTQIAAFNLALTAWRMIGFRFLPPLNLACSGLGIHAKEEEWVELAGKDQRLRDSMSELYQLFKKGPVLGSLINPRALNRPSPLLIADFHAIQPVLEAALRHEQLRDYEAAEMAISAQGMAKAGEILTGQFTLVATNVPYLGRGKQDDVIKDYCDRVYPKTKADLATCFVERCLGFCSAGGSTALVSPQNWMSLSSYRGMRHEILRNSSWKIVARLGPKCFQTPMWDFNIVLVCISQEVPTATQQFSGIDVGSEATPEMKAQRLNDHEPMRLVSQRGQLRNPDCRIVIGEEMIGTLLANYVSSIEGLSTGDSDRFILSFWEFPRRSVEWEWYIQNVGETCEFGARSNIIRWESGCGSLHSSPTAHNFPSKVMNGRRVLGERGLRITQMGNLAVTFYTGELFGKSGATMVPHDRGHLPAVWAFCSSPEYLLAVRQVDQKLNVTNATLAKVPFDLERWQKVAVEMFPDGLPMPHSDDPTQWLFNGSPRDSTQPLHIAVARLLGYQWPRQTGSSFSDCPAVTADGLDKLADEDGIVCLDALQGELSAAERLRALLAAAYGGEWSPAKQAELLAQVKGESIDQWLREKFFEQHCALFHNRPFVWHIWDGMKNGFHALVNYHKLAAPNGDGRRVLERLIFSYLGDWIKQQRNDQKNGVEGADARVAAAEHLKKQLNLILNGETPHDIFVRWKPLPEQSISWQPDLNDGVRINIRPFVNASPLNPRGRNACILRVTPKIKWEKDRGKEPYREKDDFPWFWSWDQSSSPDYSGGQKFDGNRWNDLHYSLKFKQASRVWNSSKKAQKI